MKGWDGGMALEGVPIVDYEIGGGACYEKSL